NLFGRERDVDAIGLDPDRVWINKLGAALNDRDFVSPELMPDHFQFAFLDYAHAGGKVLFADPLLHRIVAPVERALTEPGHIQDRFSQRLAGNSAGVQRNPAKHPFAVNYRHLLSVLRCGNCAFLSGGTAAYHNQIVCCVIHYSPRFLGHMMKTSVCHLFGLLDPHHWGRGYLPAQPASGGARRSGRPRDPAENLKRGRPKNRRSARNTSAPTRDRHATPAGTMRLL